MVVSCCAFGCKERFSKGGAYTFHSFPIDKYRRKLWIKHIRRENFKVSEHTRICSKHFEADCFEGQLCIRRLKSDAVPTIFDFPAHVMEHLKPKEMEATEENLTSSTVIYPSTKSYRYIGDFSESDMASPAKAQLLLLIAREYQKKSQKEMKILKQRKTYLTKKVSSLEDLINKMISDRSSMSNSAGSFLKSAAVFEEEFYPLEPTVVIKEEPFEFEPTPSTSTEPDCLIKDEFILPHEENAWTSADSLSSWGTVPTGQMRFSVPCLGTDQDKTSATSPVPDNPMGGNANPSKLSVSGPAQKGASTSLNSSSVPTSSTTTGQDSLIKDQFILPDEENAWTSADSRPSSGVDPSSQATFSVVGLGTEKDKTSSTNPVIDDPLKQKRKDSPSKLSVSGPAQKVASTSLGLGIVPTSSTTMGSLIKDPFILPYEENAWTSADSRPSSGVDPSSQATFSVVCLGTEQDKTSSTSPVIDDPLKRKRKDSPSELSVSGPAQKVARTPLNSSIAPTECLQTALGNPDDSSSQSSLDESKTGDRPHDQFDAFGEYIVSKLRSLDKRSCAFVQKAVGDVFFEGEMGKFIGGTE